MRLALFLLLAFSNSVFAQTSDKLEAWLPKSVPNGELLLSVVIAKADVTSKTILLARPTFREETLVVTKQKWIVMHGTRSRSVVGDDGVSREEEFTFSEPVMHLVEVPCVVKRPTGSEKCAVPLAEARAWTWEGKAIEPSDLLKRLEKATHIVAWEMDPRVEYSAIDAYYRFLFKPETIVLFVPPGAWERFAK